MPGYSRSLGIAGIVVAAATAFALSFGGLSDREAGAGPKAALE